MKSYQISEDRLIVVKKDLVTTKQKDSEKSFEFTPSRLVLHMLVTTSLVCVNLQRFIFHFSVCFGLFLCVNNVGGTIDGFLLFYSLLLFLANKFLFLSSLMLYVRLSCRWACFCQSLPEINIAVQQLE